MTFLGYITIGLLIGWLSRIITKERGVRMLPSLFFGVIGAVTGASVILLLNIAGAAFYAVVGAIGVLFTVNVFRQDDPIFTTSDTV